DVYKRQLQALRQLGCRVAQGHAFGRPMPAEALQALLERGPVAVVHADEQPSASDQPAGKAKP
ncbi:MAG: hypothetical protein N2109_03760, partial [Fimbriimonadales bacterium]|nr:hypothetical protein [Fimbriimonadales bacterium]